MENKPVYRAVRLFGQVVAPKVEFCDKCDTLLQYWNGKEGYVWICPKCMKMKKKD
jgi:hypothetical protein